MEAHLKTYQQLLNAALTEGCVLPQQVKALSNFRELHHLSDDDHNSCLAAIGWSPVTWRSACFAGTQPKTELANELEDLYVFLIFLYEKSFCLFSVFPFSCFVYNFLVSSFSFFFLFGFIFSFLFFIFSTFLFRPFHLSKI